MVAKIFSLWSILKIDKNELSFIITPHMSQIVAILILVGAVKSSSALKNQLVQVLTGEGKSIVLAGVCCYFALKKYKVYCACYSEYLSQRDQKAFNELFYILNVETEISYGIFNKHCEEVLNSKKGESFR